VIAPALREHIAIEIAKATTPLRERLAELDARPAGLKYCGVCKAVTAYAVHEGVIFNGSLWVALRDTTGQPGTLRLWVATRRQVRRAGKDLR
jgi:hypothetical protein